MSEFNLIAFSEAVADIAESAGAAVASIRRGHMTASAFHWSDGFYVAAEEAVDADEVQMTLPSGEAVQAELAGRDPSTGIALLRASPAAPAAVLPTRAGRLRPGNLVVAVGRGGQDLLASFGAAGFVGPAWRSMRGGEIASRITLAITAGGRFEGGPVLDAGGALVGMLLFGQRRRILVIPHETIEGAVAALRDKGHVARGYLGAGLQPVHDQGVHGAMVVSLDADGPARAAGLQLGDIITAWGEERVHGPRDLIRRLGPDSVGRDIALTLLRGGEARTLSVTIGEKPLS